MKKEITSLAVVALFMLSALTVRAFADDPMDRCNMMGMHDQVWNKMDLDEMVFYKARFILANSADIGLTDEQAEKIMSLKYNTKKNLIKAEADIESLALDIKEELRKDDININAVNSLIDKKYALKNQKAKDLIAAYVNIKKTLTKEQMAKLKNIWPGDKMKKCMQMGGMGKKMPMMREMEEK